MKNNELNEIVRALKAAPETALVSHYNPDSDAYGAICALGLGLEQIGRRIWLLNRDGAQPNYLFIPGVARVTNSFPANFAGTVVVCDCGDLNRVGDELKPEVAKASCVINIDHHVSSEYFGQYNLVREQASSTSEIIFDVLQAAGATITAEMAIGLFAGIMGDTGSFRYANTSQKTLQVAEKLVGFGVKPHLVAEALYSNNSLAAVQLQAAALANLKMHFENRVCEVIVDQDLFKRCGAKPDDTDMLVEKARDIEGVLISFLIQSWEGLWRISLRSRDAAQDVSKVAAHFGGGGHKNAAGLRWRGELSALRPALLEEIRKIL